MKIEEIWARYQEIDPEAVTYQAWSFCDGGAIGDELANLVLDGKKKGTASAYPLYEVEGAPLPSVGGLNIILWSNGDAACLTRTIGVEVIRFSEVTPEHAYNEGEGDLSLDHWRRVHKDYFSKELEEVGLRFSEDMMVVYERFELVFR